MAVVAIIQVRAHDNHSFLVDHNTTDCLCILAAMFARHRQGETGRGQNRPHREASESPDPEVKCSLLQVFLSSSSSVLLFVMDPPDAPHKLCTRHKWGTLLAVNWKRLEKYRVVRPPYRQGRVQTRHYPSTVRYSTAQQIAQRRIVARTNRRPQSIHEGLLPLSPSFPLHLPAAHCSLSFPSFARSSVGVVIIIISSWPLFLRPSFCPFL